MDSKTVIVSETNRIPVISKESNMTWLDPNGLPCASHFATVRNMSLDNMQLVDIFSGHGRSSCISSNRIMKRLLDTLSYFTPHGTRRDPKCSDQTRMDMTEKVQPDVPKIMRCIFPDDWLWLNIFSNCGFESWCLVLSAGTELWIASLSNSRITRFTILALEVELARNSSPIQRHE